MFFRGKLGDTVSFNYRNSHSGRFHRRVVRVTSMIDSGEQYALQEDGSVIRTSTHNNDMVEGYVVSEGPMVYKRFLITRIIGKVRLVKRTIV